MYDLRMGVNSTDSRCFNLILTQTFINSDASKQLENPTEKKRILSGTNSFGMKSKFQHINHSYFDVLIK